MDQLLNSSNFICSVYKMVISNLLKPPVKLHVNVGGMVWNLHQCCLNSVSLCMFLIKLLRDIELSKAQRGTMKNKSA